MLRNAADSEVRSSVFYQAMFLAAWALVLTWVLWFGSLIGLDWLGDGIERQNRAAAWAGVGLTFGATLVVSGANIGQGPMEWTTLCPMFLASGSLLAFWALFSALRGNAAAIVVDRDRASGLRLAIMLLAWGLILGRAVAGDWVSLDATWRDVILQRLVPGLALLGLALVLEVCARPTRRRPFPSMVLCEIIPACLLLWLAPAWIFYLGVPS